MNILKLKKRAVSLILAFAAVICCTSVVGCSKTVTAIKYKSTAISENMYSYWLATLKAQFVYNYNSGNDTDELWSTLVDGTDVTYEEYAEDEIIRTIKYFAIAGELFKEYGLKIDSETRTAIDDDIDEKIDYYGGRAELNTALAEYGINIDILRDVCIAEEKWYAVYDYLYGDSGIEALSEADLDAYYAAHYSRIKVAIIYTDEKLVLNEDGTYQTDSEGHVKSEALTDEEKALKSETIVKIQSEIDSGTDFDSVISEYSEVDTSYYVNGFHITSESTDDFGYELIKAVSEMSENDIGRVDGDGVTYFVEKLPLMSRSEFLDCDSEQVTDLEDNAKLEKYYAKFDSYASDVTVNEDVISAHSIKTAPMNTYF